SKQGAGNAKQRRIAGCPEKTCRNGSDGKAGSGATRAGGKGREGKITGRAKETARCARPGRLPRLDAGHTRVQTRSSAAQKGGRRESENRSDRHLVAYSGENSRNLAIGCNRSEQSQS